MKVPDDNNWGTVYEDGTVTGMVGEVASRRAHLAITQITITGKFVYRQTVWLINRGDILYIVVIVFIINMNWLRCRIKLS